MVVKQNELNTAPPNIRTLMNLKNGEFALSDAGDWFKKVGQPRNGETGGYFVVVKSNDDVNTFDLGDSSKSWQYTATSHIHKATNEELKTKPNMLDDYVVKNINANFNTTITTGGKTKKNWVSTGRKASIKVKGADGKFRVVQRTVYTSASKPGQQRIAYKAADGSRKFKTFKAV